MEDEDDDDDDDDQQPPRKVAATNTRRFTATALPRPSSARKTRAQTRSQRQVRPPIPSQSSSIDVEVRAGTKSSHKRSDPLTRSPAHSTSPQTPTNDRNQRFLDHGSHALVASQYQQQAPSVESDSSESLPSTSKKSPGRPKRAIEDVDSPSADERPSKKLATSNTETQYTLPHESENPIPSPSVAQGYHDDRAIAGANDDKSEIPTESADDIAEMSKDASHASNGDDTEISQSKTHTRRASKAGTQTINIAPANTTRPNTSPTDAAAEQQLSLGLGSASDSGCPLRNTQLVHPPQASSLSSGLISGSALNGDESGPADVLLPPQSVRLSRAVREDENETEILQWIEKRDIPPWFEDKEDTCQVMEQLNMLGFICVDFLLEDTKIPRRQPLRLDPDIYYPDELLELLATLMGCSTDDAIARFTGLSNTEHQKHVELYAIIRALLASAMKQWCLEPSPQGEDFFEVPHMKAVLKGVSNLIGPLASKHVGNASLQAYIEEFVEPNINKNARKLATKFDSFMSFLLPNRAPGVNCRNYIDRMRAFTASEHDAVDGSQPPITNQWQAQWLDRLTEIFEVALQWKSRVTKYCNGDYTFGFPPYMTKYERWFAHVRDEPSPLDGNPDSRVLLTLMPSVSTRNRSRLSENIQDKPWSTIYQGLVLVGLID